METRSEKRNRLLSSEIAANPAFAAGKKLTTALMLLYVALRCLDFVFSYLAYGTGVFSLTNICAILASVGVAVAAVMYGFTKFASFWLILSSLSSLLSLYMIRASFGVGAFELLGRVNTIGMIATAVICIGIGLALLAAPAVGIYGKRRTEIQKQLAADRLQARKG